MGKLVAPGAKGKRFVTAVYALIVAIEPPYSRRRTRARTERRCARQMCPRRWDVRSSYGQNGSMNRPFGAADHERMVIPLPCASSCSAAATCRGGSRCRRISPPAASPHNLPVSMGLLCSYPQRSVNFHGVAASISGQKQPVMTMGELSSAQAAGGRSRYERDGRDGQMTTGRCGLDRIYSAYLFSEHA